MTCAVNGDGDVFYDRATVRPNIVDLFTAYFEWVERAKLEGGFVDIETDVAALFLENQHIGAMRMQREGISNETIANVLNFAFKMAFFKKPKKLLN